MHWSNPEQPHTFSRLFIHHFLYSLNLSIKTHSKLGFSPDMLKWRITLRMKDVRERKWQWSSRLHSSYLSIHYKFINTPCHFIISLETCWWRGLIDSLSQGGKGFEWLSNFTFYIKTLFALELACASHSLYENLVILGYFRKQWISNKNDSISSK